MKLAKNLSKKDASQGDEIAGQRGCSPSLGRLRVDAPSQEIRDTSSGHRPSSSRVAAAVRRRPSLFVSVAHCRSLCSDSYSDDFTDNYSDGRVVGPSTGSTVRRPLLNCSADANLGAHHLPPLGAGFFVPADPSLRSVLEAKR